MNIEYNLYKKIKFIILFIVIIVLLSISKVYASTINESLYKINIDANGICNVEEILNVTAIEDSSDYTTKYFTESPSMQLTRGKNIERLSINNLEIPESDIDNYYNDNLGIINLAYPKTRKVSIFFIVHKKINYNFL